MVKRAKLDIELNVEYVPVPEERMGAWRAGISLLLQMFYEEREFCKPAVVNRVWEDGDERVDLDRDRNAGGGVAALLSLAHAATRTRTAKTLCVHAWVIGHDGSVHRMALADWSV